MRGNGAAVRSEIWRTVLVVAAIALMLLIGMAIQRAKGRAHQLPPYGSTLAK
jgi:hypothetical protein